MKLKTKLVSIISLSVIVFLSLVGATISKYETAKNVDSLDFDIPQKYNVTYNLDKGTSNPSTNKTQYDITTNTWSLAELSQSGYEFKGWTIGKNLFDGKLEIGILNKTGELSTDTQTIRSINYIEVKPNTQYTISNESKVNIFVHFYDSSYNQIAFNNGQGHPKTITTPSNCKYIKIRTQQAQGITNTNLKIQVEEGSYSTAYEPYIGTPTTNITIAKGSEGNRTYQAHWIKAPVTTENYTYVKERVISLAGTGCATEGVKNYEYYISTKNLGTNPIISSITGTTTDKITMTTEGNYWVYYRTVSNLNQKSRWSSERVRIDTTPPEADIYLDVREDGTKYIVLDTMDKLSGVKNSTDNNNVNLINNQVPLKVWVAGTYRENIDYYPDYAKILTDFGLTEDKFTVKTWYTNVSAASPSITPTYTELVAGGYNTIIYENRNFAVNKVVDDLFNQGINVISVGNDSSSSTIPTMIKSHRSVNNTLTNTYTQIVDNVFTRRMGDINFGQIKDTMAAVKFQDDVQVFYSHKVQDDDNLYDGVGYLIKNNTQWMHSQMALNLEGVESFISTSLNYLSKKDLYYYKVTEPGTYTFKIIDNAGNILTKEYLVEDAPKIKNINVSENSTGSTLKFNISDDYAGLEKTEVYMNNTLIKTINHNGQNTLSITESLPIVDLDFYEDSYIITTDKAGEQTKSDLFYLNTTKIRNKKDMNKFSYVLNEGITDFEGQTVSIINNIDMQNSSTDQWIPATSSDNVFKGTLDGNYHIISNLYTDDNAKYDYAAFIGYNNGTIQNLLFKNINMISRANSERHALSGSIAGQNRGMIKNCGIISGNIQVINTIAYPGYWLSIEAGGIASSNIGTIENCYNKANVSGNIEVGYEKLENYIGGITGGLGNGIIKNCYNTGNITSQNSSYIGGINGVVTWNSTTNVYIENSYNIGTLSQLGTISSNHSSGNISGNGTQYLHITNSYFINGSIHGRASSTPVVSNSSLVNSSTLKGYASTLGNEWTNDSININNGYPILKWQLNVNY